jgi:hypothetical protein
MVKKESQEYLPTAEDPKGRPWGNAQRFFGKFGHITISCLLQVIVQRP